MRIIVRQSLGKLTITTQELKSTFCLSVKATFLHYPEAPSSYVITDGFLPIPMSHEDAFLGPEGH